MNEIDKHGVFLLCYISFFILVVFLEIYSVGVIVVLWHHLCVCGTGNTHTNTHTKTSLGKRLIM